jgi:CheY-like chemotaxis protein
MRFRRPWRRPHRPAVAQRGEAAIPTILIIDDDKLVRETTKILLRAKGFDVAVAANGKDGIAAIEGGMIDLAIVDLFMPDMDGLQVVEAVRRINPALPIIVASGFMFEGECPQMPGFEVMAAEAGAIQTLYKPLRPNEVLRAVTTALAKAEAAPSAYFGVAEVEKV